jgi:hypothetical protein
LGVLSWNSCVSNDFISWRFDKKRNPAAFSYKKGGYW